VIVVEVQVVVVVLFVQCLKWWVVVFVAVFDEGGVECCVRLRLVRARCVEVWTRKARLSSVAVRWYEACGRRGVDW